MTVPAFTLVIPAYNEESYLPRLLDSVRAARDRFHRGPHPSPEHAGYADLGSRDRARVCVLAALLRFADALDAEHADRVASVELRISAGGVALELRPGEGADPELALEREALGRKLSLFEEVFGVPVTLGS